MKDNIKHFYMRMVQILKLTTIIALFLILLSSCNLFDVSIITFHSNGGEGSMSNQTVETGVAVHLNKNRFSYEGHVFSGWSLEYNSKVGYIDEDAILVLEDLDLFAQWENEQFNVYFDPQGGTTLSPEYIKVSYNGTYYNLPTTEKENYVFNGWWTLPSGGQKITNSIKIIKNESHYLYAHWVPAVTVSLESNGGLLESTSTIKTGMGFEYGDLPIPTKDGFVFGGWFTSLPSGELVTNDTIVEINMDHILYAKWGKEILITFNYNGGTVGDFSNKIVGEGLKYGDFPESSKPGYTFNGWWTNLNFEEMIDNTSIVTNSTDHTLYANWIPNTYTIRFDPQGGCTPSPPYIEAVYEKPIGELPTTEKENRILIGWFTEKNGEGLKIDEDSIYNFNTDLKLYAYWNFPVTTGPAGGYVFYDKGYYSDGWRYLESADELLIDQEWGAYGHEYASFASDGELGDGLMNSIKIVDYHNNLLIIYPEKLDFYTHPDNYYKNSDGSVAAKFCLNYSLEHSGKVFNDWYLPSIDELSMMYEVMTRQGIGNFNPNRIYWSSTESTGSSAKSISFSTGTVNLYSKKYYNFRVRPIRRY